MEQEREKLIDAIIGITPGPDLVNGSIPDDAEGVFPVNTNPILAKFGAYVCGVGEYWLWYDRRNFAPEKVLHEGRLFLQDANVDELEQLFAILSKDK